MTYRILAIAVMFLALLGTAVAQEGAAEKVTAAQAGEITLLADESAAIKAVLDSEGFSLPAGIGEEIDNARMSGDPADSWEVLLALIKAENASGNECEMISSLQLLEEAVEKARRNQDALALMTAAYAYEVIGDEDMRDSLMAESEAAASSDEGEKAGPYTFDLEVNNWWDEPAELWLDDWYLGTVYPGYYMYFNDIGVGWYYLYAYGIYSGGYTVVDVEGDPWSFTSVDLVY